MEKISNVAYSVVALVVMVLIIATVAIPVVENVQNQQVKAENNSDYYFAMLPGSSSQSLTISQSYATLTINSTTMAIDYSYEPIVFGDNYLLIAGDITSASSMIEFIFGDTRVAGVSQVVWSAGELTYTVSGSSTTVTVGDIYYPSSSGTYGLYRMSDGAVYVDADNLSEVKALMLKTSIPIAASDFTFNGSGTVTYTHVPQAYSSTETLTTYSTSVNIAATDLGYVINSITGSVTFSETGTVSLNSSYFYVVAPIEYTVIDTGGVNYTLLGIIPLVLLIVPIMFCVRIFASGRD